MSILIDENTRVIVQGITGRDGAFHAEQMMAYGTKVVGGVTPGKGGQTVLGVPVFNTMEDAVKTTQANTSVIFVPARLNAADAIIEAAKSGIKLIVCISENIPTQDMIRVNAILRSIEGVHLIGPNCPGLITPGKCKVGIIPPSSFTPGSIGLVSRSGTLTYEIADALTSAGLGQSTGVGIGGDAMIGSTFVDILPLFEADPQTEAVVLVGEIGGSDEENAASYIKQHMKKPVVGFIGGRTAPPGKRMGHAGAIISGSSGTPQAKVEALMRAGVPVAESMQEIPDLVKRLLGTNKNGVSPTN